MLCVALRHIYGRQDNHHVSEMRQIHRRTIQHSKRNEATRQCYGFWFLFLLADLHCAVNLVFVFVFVLLVVVVVRGAFLAGIAAGTVSRVPERGGMRSPKDAKSLPE